MIGRCVHLGVRSAKTFLTLLLCYGFSSWRHYWKGSVSQIKSKFRNLSSELISFVAFHHRGNRCNNIYWLVCLWQFKRKKKKTAHYILIFIHSDLFRFSVFQLITNKRVNKTYSKGNNGIVNDGEMLYIEREGRQILTLPYPMVQSKMSVSPSHVGTLDLISSYKFSLKIITFPFLPSFFTGQLSTPCWRPA